MQFLNLNPAPGILMLPYLLRVSFASILNASLWWLNR
ncbi:MAG: tryptophan-rich sensory protein [Chloroflexi bacterium]|nr:tryptophan-rich sensory protein [Chloroflexota bacterium]